VRGVASFPPQSQPENELPLVTQPAELERVGVSGAVGRSYRLTQALYVAGHEQCVTVQQTTVGARGPAFWIAVE